MYMYVCILRVYMKKYTYMAAMVYAKSSAHFIAYAPQSDINFRNASVDSSAWVGRA